MTRYPDPRPPAEVATHVPDWPDLLDAADLLEEGRRFEGEGVLDRALECYERAAKWCADRALVAEALTHQSRVYRCRSEWTPALDCARRAQELASVAGLSGPLAEGIIAEANVLMCRGDFAGAEGLFQRVLATTDEPRVRGIALQNVGSILAQQGKLGAAERAFAESLGCFRRAGYQLGEATALNNQGRVILDRGNAALAVEVLDQALTVARAVGYAELIALAMVNRAEAFIALGDLVRAEEAASTALGYFAVSGNRWREIECLRVIGTINERLGGIANAVRCYERALSIANELGAQQDQRILRDCLSRIQTRST